MIYHDFVVLSDDVECVLEYCSFFFDPDTKRIICVPDSMYANFCEMYSEINKLVLLGNDPKMLVASSPFLEEEFQDEPEEDGGLVSDLVLGFDYKGFYDEEYYYGEEGVRRYHE